MTLNSLVLLISFLCVDICVTCGHQYTLLISKCLDIYLNFVATKNMVVNRVYWWPQLETGYQHGIMVTTSVRLVINKVYWDHKWTIGYQQGILGPNLEDWLSTRYTGDHIWTTGYQQGILVTTNGRLVINKVYWWPRVEDWLSTR